MESGRPGRAVALTFTAGFERIVIARMTFDTDVLEALKRSVAQERIKNAVSCPGSLAAFLQRTFRQQHDVPIDECVHEGRRPVRPDAVNGYVIDGACTRTSRSRTSRKHWEAISARNTDVHFRDRDTGRFRRGRRSFPARRQELALDDRLEQALDELNLAGMIDVMRGDSRHETEARVTAARRSPRQLRISIITNNGL